MSRTLLPVTGHLLGSRQSNSPSNSQSNSQSDNQNPSIHQPLNPSALNPSNPPAPSKTSSLNSRRSARVCARSGRRPGVDGPFHVLLTLGMGRPPLGLPPLIGPDMGPHWFNSLPPGGWRATLVQRPRAAIGCVSLTFAYHYDDHSPLPSTPLHSTLYPTSCTVRLTSLRQITTCAWSPRRSRLLGLLYWLASSLLLLRCYHGCCGGDACSGYSAIWRVHPGYCAATATTR